VVTRIPLLITFVSLFRKPNFICLELPSGLARIGLGNDWGNRNGHNAARRISAREAAVSTE